MSCLWRIDGREEVDIYTMRHSIYTTHNTVNFPVKQVVVKYYERLFSAPSSMTWIESGPAKFPNLSLVDWPVR